MDGDILTPRDEEKIKQQQQPYDRQTIGNYAIEQAQIENYDGVQEAFNKYNTKYGLTPKMNGHMFINNQQQLVEWDEEYAQRDRIEQAQQQDYERRQERLRQLAATPPCEEGIRLANEFWSRIYDPEYVIGLPRSEERRVGKEC